MNTTHQNLDRTSVIALALTVVSLAVAWVANIPAAPATQAIPVVVSASDAAAASADEGRYKIVVTGLRLRPVPPTAVANVGSAAPRI